MQIAFSLALASWLLLVAVSDVQRMEVSNWLTLPLLTIGVPASCVASRSIVPLFIAALMWVMAEAPVIWWIVPFVTLPLTVAFPEWKAMLWGWCIAVSLWKAGALGGADAKVIMALTVLIPDMRLVWLLLIVWTLVDLARLLVRHKQRTAAHIVKFLMGDNTGVQAPALPAIALGGVAYLLLFLLGTSGNAVFPWHLP